MDWNISKIKCDGPQRLNSFWCWVEIASGQRKLIITIFINYHLNIYITINMIHFPLTVHLKCIAYRNSSSPYLTLQALQYNISSCCRHSKSHFYYTYVGASRILQICINHKKRNTRTNIETEHLSIFYTHTLLKINRAWEKWKAVFGSTSFITVAPLLFYSTRERWFKTCLSFEIKAFMKILL